MAKRVYRIKSTKRGGKVALWILGWNIWDLHKDQLTPDVMSAIANAYNLGRKQALDDLSCMDQDVLNVTDPRKPRP